MINSSFLKIFELSGHGDKNVDSRLRDSKHVDFLAKFRNQSLSNQ